jgi:GMP synthase (glutamine-hydrolysing)
VKTVCLQHVAAEGPAEIATWAKARGHELETVRLYEPGHSHPSEPDFLVIMGGPMNVYEDDTYPFLGPERRYIASAIDDGALVLGVCLGAQLLADVMGGTVHPGEHVEIGWYPVSRTPDGDACPVMGRLPEVVEVIHWHGDTFEVPPSAARTYSSEACPNQSFSYDGGRVIGLQFHLEQSPESLQGMIDAFGDDLVDGPWIQHAEEVVRARESFRELNEHLFTMLDAMSAVRTG